MQLHFVGDILIWLAYFAIPVVLVAFAWPRRRSLPYPHIFGLFAAFILSCGLAHMLEAISVVQPVYRLSGFAKAVTAAVSWLTVFALVPIVRNMSLVIERRDPPDLALTSRPYRGGPHPYLFAATTVLVATGLRYVLSPLLGHHSLPFLIYFLATKTSAWYGGFGPCLLAVILSGGVVWYVNLGDHYSFSGLTLPEMLSLAIYLFIGVFTGLMAESLLASRRVVEDTNARLMARTKQLEDLNAELEQRVLDRTQALVASNAELEQFAYVASHDLQEPLRMVGSFCQLLEERYKDKLDDRGREFIHYAVDGAKRMQLLVNDLLAYARVTSKAKPPQRISATETFAQVCDALKLAIDDAKATIRSTALPDVWMDLVQLAQLFQNLLANAIKFRRAGVAPEVSVSALFLPNGFCQFAVQDNGIGINKKHQDKLFAIFQRLHTREEYEGTGIGLALCKKIVERHGGRIWLESTEGVGTTFFFTLPCGGPSNGSQRSSQDLAGGRQSG